MCSLLRVNMPLLISPFVSADSLLLHILELLAAFYLSALTFRVVIVELSWSLDTVWNGSSSDSLSPKKNCHSCLLPPTHLVPTATLQFWSTFCSKISDLPDHTTWLRVGDKTQPYRTPEPQRVEQDEFASTLVCTWEVYLCVFWRFLP